MRVPTTAFGNNLITQLNLLQGRQNRLQNQAATGQKITLPEDDPSAVQNVLNLQATARSTSQYQANIATLQSQATTSYNAINGLKTISNRAGEIATLADGLSSPQEQAAYATEVGNLIKQAVQIGNTKDQGSYILGGTVTDAPPFVATTDANGLVNAVTYQGNTSVASVEIGENDTVSAQTLGANTTGAGPAGLITDSRSGADFLNHLISLQNHLLAGDTAAINATDTPQLAKDETNILNHISDNGALQSRLDTTNTMAGQQGLTLSSRISDATSADIATTLTELSQAQTAYKAALQSGAQLLGTSLLDYLH